MAKNLRNKISFSFLGIIFLIVLAGFLLRCWGLDQYPVEFHSQEALLGWRAKSLMLTAKDETGRQLPLIFSSQDGYQLPLASYLIVPSVKLFGLKPWAVRLPFALVGTLAIPALLGIVYFLFPRDKKMALWSAFFLAINPWTVYLSRDCSAINLSFSLFLLGFFFWLVSQQGKKAFHWLAVIFFLASLFSAKIAWLFLLPFLLLSWLFLFKKERKMMVDIIIVILGFLPLAYLYFNAPQVKIDLLNHDLTFFSEPSIKTSIELMRGENLKFGNPYLGRIFYNKLFYLQNLSVNFLRHFNPRFYFTSGDNQPLHGLTNFGPILFVFLFTTLGGIWWFWQKQRKFLIFMVVWFCLAIIPSILVLPSPDQTRTIFVLPILAIITASFLSRIKRGHLLIFLTFLGLNFAFVFHDALIKEPLRFQEERQVGYRQLALYLKGNFDKYQIIYLTDAYGADPGPALLFYFDFPVEGFQKTQAPELFYRKWFERIDKIFIDRRDLWAPGEENLYIVSPDDDPLHQGGVFKKIETIRNLSGEPIFLIFKYEKEI
jgi:4-amino-4-deoxy-L-arabinose transferase-like glycosyltransferase